MTPPPTLPIFPPFHPHTKWRAVDDRIRGGSSVSHLDTLDTTQSHAGAAARFWGTLDITTLGGAGFASQCHTFEPRALRLCKEEYQGLAITFDVTPPAPAPVEEEKPKHFTLVLKGSIPPLRPDGRRESTLSYEYTFINTSCTSTSSTTIDNPHEQQHQRRTITIPWSDFSPTYRGRPITPKDPQYTPLDPGSVDPRNGEEQGGIAEISLMCRSGFGKQQGEFELVVRRIEAVRVGASAACVHGGGGKGKGMEDGDLEKQAWDDAVHRQPPSRPQARFRAVSWKTIGLVTVVCIGLSVLATRWWAKL
ncbi:hypothetical protein QFC24_000034 [Naganishia onofrii]|uniref:Uncharacterized protein n=1 Tax=Naganishia onofrii TaxID=1851511 RepID=A0ACC2XXB6_9TREE|nr:hypothetical protein QFC24_000034 [Naganishia onofrii]